MRTKPYTPLSIWTTPKLNRDEHPTRRRYGAAAAREREHSSIVRKV